MQSWSWHCTSLTRPFFLKLQIKLVLTLYYPRANFEADRMRGRINMQGGVKNEVSQPNFLLPAEVICLGECLESWEWLMYAYRE